MKILHLLFITLFLSTSTLIAQNPVQECRDNCAEQLEDERQIWNDALNNQIQNPGDEYLVYLTTFYALDYAVQNYACLSLCTADGPPELPNEEQCIELLHRYIENHRIDRFRDNTAQFESLLNLIKHRLRPLGCFPLDDKEISAPQTPLSH